MLVSVVATLRPLAPGLLAGAGAAATLAVLRPARRLQLLPALGVAIATLVYGGGIVGILALHGIVFGIARVVLATAGASAGERGARRWRLARAAMIAFGGLALAGRATGWTSWQLPVGRFSWAPLYLDIMMFARLQALIWEVGSGRVTRLPLAPFLRWSALPVALFGPLLRFSEWLTQEEAGLAGPDDEARRRAARLLGLGAAQLAAFVAIAALRPALGPAPGQHLWLKTADWFGFNPWSFYLAVAGYSNLLIAAGAWSGIRLPTVFDRPFGRPNLSAFWAHWNIPITSLARDVMFYGRWGLGRGDAYVSAVAVFAAIGLWHAGNAYWLVWGLMHGVGYCVFLAYTRQLRSGGRAARAVQAIVPGRLVTYLFVCGCWAFAPQVVRLLKLL